MSNRVLLGILLLGLTGFAQAQTITAEPSSDDALLLACHQAAACMSHLDKANESYMQNRYDTAIEEYQAAYVLQPYPPFLYNIARLHHKQKHLSVAIAYYQRYLSSSHPTQVERARQFLSEATQELDVQDSQAEPPSAPLTPESPPIFASGPAPTASRPKKPTAKKWWLWTVVGLAAAGAATAIGIGVYASGPNVSGLPGQTASLRH